MRNGKPGAYLRKRTVQAEFMLPGRRAHERFVRAAAVLDDLLAALLPSPPAAAPIFVIGPQRSGTTLFYKCLQRHHQVCYIDQAANFFPEAYLVASAWLRAIGAHKATDFLQAYDVKRDLWIRTWMRHGYDYSEGNLVWSRLGRGGSWESEQSRAWARRHLPRLVERIRKLSRRPVFINKCPANSLRIGLLLELFPGSRFIHVQRDPRGVINSMVAIHRELGVESWGPMPLPKEATAGCSDYEAVARQWVAITRLAEEGLAQVPGDRKLTVQYEAFMREPDATLGEVAERFGLEPFKSAMPAGLFRTGRASGWRTEMPPHERAQVEAVLEDGGFADWMIP